jgi:hypothetical protein
MAAGNGADHSTRNLRGRRRVVPLMRSRVTLFLISILAVASTTFAGLAYDFESTTTGVGARTMTGSVRAEDSKVRVTIGKGDGILFKDGSVIVSTDGGQTLAVMDPATKSYYDLDLGDLLGDASGFSKQFGGAVSFDIKNPRVAVRDRGDAGKVEGYPVKKSVLDSSYDMGVNVMGQKMPMKINMSTEVLWTDRLGAEFTNFLQLRGMRTGIDAVDKIISAQTAGIKGFPLHQKTTTRIEMNGNTMTSTATSKVSRIQKTKVTEAEFALPAGYARTESPIQKMMKSFSSVP